MAGAIDIHSLKKTNTDEFLVLQKRTSDYILSIPHGGTLIPVEYSRKLNINKDVLTGTDMHTDKAYDTNKGIMIVSLLNPYLVNMSRYREGNKDPLLPTHMQRDPLHGRSLEGKNILIEEYNPTEKDKILFYYDKYHELIMKSIQEMKQKQGFALIFDCHSMNPKGLEITPDKGQERPDFNVGTLDDTSASKEIIDIFYNTLKQEAEKHGLTVLKNHPYKGGFITRKYGKPGENIHAIQLEIKKTNYMNDKFEIDSIGLQKINAIISKVFEKTAEKAKKLT